MCGGFLHHGPQAADVLSGSDAAVEHALDSTPRLCDIRWFLSQPAQTGTAAGHNCGERLADFMGYRGGKFSESRHASNVREFRPSLMHLLFNSSCPSDIHDRANEF